MPSCQSCPGRPTSWASCTVKPVASWSSSALAAGPNGGTSLHVQVRWHHGMTMSGSQGSRRSRGRPKSCPGKLYLKQEWPHCIQPLTSRQSQAIAAGRLLGFTAGPAPRT